MAGDLRQRIKVIVLVVVALGAIFFALRAGGLFGPKIPQVVLDRPEEMIDSKSYDVFTKTLGEWEKLGHNEAGFYKNPNTGEFTICRVFPCPHCGAKLPVGGITAVPPKIKCPKCGATVSPP